MSKRSKYTAEEKYQIIKTYEDGVGSTREIIFLYKISKLKMWFELSPIVGCFLTIGLVILLLVFINGKN